MIRSNLATVSIATVVVLGFVTPLLVATAGPAGATHLDNGDVRTYHAEQDDRCITLSPLGDGEETVVDFYDYQPTYSGNYSSQGTEHLQERQVSQLFVYHGTDGASLVFLHDSLEWGDEGGALSMTLTGLPADGEWVVEDDDYGEETDDNWIHSDTSSEIDWMWAPGRTDGGAFQGLEHLESGEQIHIDPAFSEESFAYQERSPTWPFADDNLTWHARNGNGELVSLDENQQVRIGAGPCESTSPTADLTQSSTEISVSESVTLDASGSQHEGDIVAYHWDVNDDGTVDATTDDPTLTHSYAAPGTYTATVTVTDETGANATATTSVSVTDETPPVAQADVNRTAVDVDEPVSFDGSNSTDNVGIASAQWEFGDGQGAESATATHAYATPGTYDAVLTVTDAAGNVDQTTVTVSVSGDDTTARLTVPETAMPDENVTFDASDSSASGAIDEYHWDVDSDGTTDRTTNEGTLSWGFSTAGDHDVTLTVVDDQGNTDTTSATVTVVDTTPTAVATVNATDVTVGTPVSFDASSSTNATAYDWQFGDGTTATGETVSHTYEETGTYEATLTATDADGDVNSTTTTITVDSPTPEPTPVVTVNETTVSTGTPVAFDGSASTAATDYEWQFGDGDTGSGETVTHTYDEPGTYEPTLTVANADGDTNSTTVSVTVTETEPAAAISVNSSTVTTGTPISFDGSASTDATAYEWQFDDDSTATGATAVYTYDEPGTYEVTLTASNDGGDVDTATTTITVEASEADDDEDDENDSADEGDPEESDSDESDGDEADETEVEGSDGGDSGSSSSSGSSGRSSGGSSGSAGGGTVSAPADDGSTDPTSVEIERVSDGLFEVTIENAKRGEPVTETVPDADNESTGLQGVEITPSTDADRLNLTLVSATDVAPPDGTDVGLFEIAVQGDPDVESVTYQIAANDSTIEGPPSRLRVFVDQGAGWTPTNHTVVSDSSPVVVNATTDNGHPVVLAANRPSLGLDSIEPLDEPTAGESTTFEAVLANDGHAPANQTVSLDVDGEPVDTQTVEVAPESTQTVTFQTTFAAAGDRELTVAGTTEIVSVRSAAADVELTDVTVHSTQLSPGDSVQAVATFENTGTAAGTATANFSVVDDVVDVERITVAPGEKVTLRFNESLDSPGNYTVSVNDEQHAVTVDQATTPTDGTDGSTTDGERWSTGLVAAGLGVLVVIAAALSRLV